MSSNTDKKSEITITPKVGDKTLPTIKAQFNPQQYSLGKSNQFASVAIPGRDSPIIQFVKGESETLSLELFFDTFSFDPQKDVREVYTKKITDLLTINPESHAPPVCTVEWGELQFTGIIEKIDSKFTMFNKDGKPVRATLTLTLKQYSELEGKRESPDRTKVRIFLEGDSLWKLAHREYGDPSKWKIIAEANDIEDPLDIDPGTQIVVPPLES